ncbi:MAG TPA: MFS transporter [Usitatibacter sp.]|nr:MFS transporter [Usitatibacter sp.]
MPALVGALGIAQIISWGSMYYAIGVLGAPMRAELGVSELFLFGSFTAGLLVCGAIAPAAGRAIDRLGGSKVLSVGSVAGALGMAVLAMANGAAMVVLGWAIAGASMAATLYDPAFATLSQHAGDKYRRAVTALTLLGGFASTVFWPLSKTLLDAFGWRATWGIYAALQIAVCLPIHMFVIPARERRGSSAQARSDDRRASNARPGLAKLNAAFAIANLVVGVVAVHMVGLLTGAGLTTSEAIAISVLMGPMQVAGRIVEMAFLKRAHATHVGVVALSLIVIAIVVLMLVSGGGVLALLFVMAYGAGNGILTIVRGAAPAEMYGAEGLGGLLGHLSRASSYARALGPATYPALVAIGLGEGTSLAMLDALLAAGLVLYIAAIREAGRKRGLA